MHKRDFSNRRSFPGTHNNDFDIVLRVMDKIERLPVILLLISLLVLAWVASWLQWQPALTLWLFMLADWTLLALLPRFNISFGPPNPTALALGLARAIVHFIASLLPGYFLLITFPFQLIGSALLLYGFYIEPHHLTVTRQSLKSAKLKPGHPIRILHLGDLHIERVTRREKQLIQLTQNLQPDLILFSGDFLNLSYLRDPQAQEDCRWVLQQLNAPLGVYVVTGSPAVDLDDVVPTLLEGLPLHWLRDECVTIEKDGQAFELIGLSCTHKPFVDGPKLVGAIQAKGPHSGESPLPESPLPFKILLYHSPDLAPEAAELGIDLQLSGHTHGGQVRLPFYGAVITGSLYGKALEVGRRQIGSLTLYVTRGLGMEGAGAPRVRFLCPPEIILWEMDGSE